MRLVVVGTSGAGKATFAQSLAKQCNLAYIELDSLFWSSNWTPVDPEEFRKQSPLSNECSSMLVGCVSVALALNQIRANPAKPNLSFGENPHAISRSIAWIKLCAWSASI